jgi:hypothetical protein
LPDDPKPLLRWFLYLLFEPRVFTTNMPTLCCEVKLAACLAINNRLNSAPVLPHTVTNLVFIEKGSNHKATNQKTE